MITSSSSSSSSSSPLSLWSHIIHDNIIVITVITMIIVRWRCRSHQKYCMMLMAVIVITIVITMIIDQNIVWWWKSSSSLYDHRCLTHKYPHDHQWVLTLQQPQHNEWLEQGLVGPLSQVAPQHLKREFNKINSSSSLRCFGKTAFLWPFDSAWCQKWFSNLHQWRIWQFWSSSKSSTMSERIKDKSKCVTDQGPREA